MISCIMSLGPSEFICVSVWKLTEFVRMFGGTDVFKANWWRDRRRRRSSNSSYRMMFSGLKIVLCSFLIIFFFEG